MPEAGAVGGLNGGAVGGAAAGETSGAAALGEDSASGPPEQTGPEGATSIFSPNPRARTRPRTGKTLQAIILTAAISLKLPSRPSDYINAS